ncbi:50S ribosomal protein L31 [Candidatus Blochmanniella vafra str. BVAF]|uniref:Large ribosomal subunit protein bL31 n=1 Tax=Blochmanniella vafra (strain BVAF) TaxID=859654 RepID=E8Q6K4_BLOVB|nr:50S ribosomal protein L31 [Candidatus Blochmannia vafer]ADV33973.1 50S ribosomal protein L31 [Candidatus Blochmannia vafer str. BVAF]
MKKDIHPQYNSIQATCSCGNIINVKSTLKNNIHLDVCSLCHPFYTGTQRVIDTRGRVNLFNKRFNKNNDNAFLSKFNKSK